LEKRRDIIIYGIFLIFKMIIFLIIYFALAKMSVIATMTVNLIIPLIVLFVMAAALNFNYKSDIRTCLVHAIILTALTFVISMMTGELIENRHKDLFNNPGSINSEKESIGDWLDRQARQYMIEQGIINEDEEIYSKPFMGEEHISDLEKDGELYARWEVQMVEQTAFGVVVETLINFAITFLGGLLAVKLWSIKNRKEKSNNSSG